MNSARNYARVYPAIVLALLLSAVFLGCSQDDDPELLAPEKIGLGTGPDPDGLVDTRLLDGEADPQFPDDPQTYPYYVVRHGPLAGRYPFASGDTVPDGAYVVFKALAASEEPAPQKLHLQGRFEAVGLIRGEIEFPFATTFSTPRLAPGWSEPGGVVAADTVGFEAGPFEYTALMRGVLWQGEIVTRDQTPAELSFHGNFPPCVQCLEIGRHDMTPDPAYADILDDTCLDQSCLEEMAELVVYDDMDPRYDPSDPGHLGFRGVTNQSTIWVWPAEGAVEYEEPAYGDFVAVPALAYHAIVYMHGKDHPQEHWPAGQAHRRIAAWRYQVDYAADPVNALADGGGLDDIERVTGFDITENVPDPEFSDLFVDPETGVWGNVIDVRVPLILMLLGEEAYWDYLTSPGAFDCPPYPEGGTPAEILAWQSEPSVQDAYAAWRLTTLQLSDGMVRAVARDQASCEHRFQTSAYHFYQGTRIPDPNGRVCEEGAYEVPPSAENPDGVLERGMLHLEDFAGESHGGDAVGKAFRIRAYRLGEADPLAVDQPPNWIPMRTGAHRNGWSASR